VEAEGRRLLARHGVRAAVERVERVPPAERSTGLRCLHAGALAPAGDLDAASAICLPLADSGAPDVARLLGHLEYRRGRPRQALEWYAKGPPDALLLAWTATAHWAIGDEAACREHADRAWRAATESGDQRALVASHVALGFAAEMVGDCAGEQHHYEKALAEAAGDRVESARMRANLSSRLLGEARFVEAAEMADQAVAQAEEVGYLTVLGIALCNGGDALLRLGDLAAAFDRFERALAVEHTVGSQRLAYPLAGLGDVHRVRGRTSLATASYEEAIRVCGAEGDRQGLVPALVGLALLLAGRDPEQAADLAERAHRDAVGPAAIRTLLALGWVAQRRGDHGSAADLAERTAEKARLHRDRARLAEALELLAAARPAKARSALGEARAIWRDTGAVLDGRRVTVLLGALPHASAEERAEARAARESLVAQGVPAPVDPVVIRTLGRFEVRVAGEPLPRSAWQSRKARDLLRILVVRRGRGIARDELARLLWDEDSGRVGHRLSVALETGRAVIDPAGTLVLADQQTVALDTGRAVIDLEDFLAAARAGLRTGDREALAAAEAAYTGDQFEDEPYDDWAVALREEVLAVYLRVTRVLATRAPDVDEAGYYLRRLLAKDPYDEQAHRDLVAALTAAGRHGAAIRARARFTEAMSALS
jgi:DNA-binding SARP family transcriptional activator/Tfp pilus assembly protein PilF